MPNRNLINTCFLSQALVSGLDFAIINPGIKEMMDVIRAHKVLSGEDSGSRKYIEMYAGETEGPVSVSESGITLEDAIIRGLSDEAKKQAEKLLKDESELSLVENRLIPALDEVGEAYEKGKKFLPQLLGSAQAAQAVFELIRESLANKGSDPIKKGTILLATVKGDIHDIGKNIVKTVLENYGYSIIDLGKDVKPEDICSAAEEKQIRLVGLSALMTTTLPSMQETVEKLKKLASPPSVMIGGAVVTADYAAKIGADYYSKDARQSVEIAKKIFG